MEVQWNEKTEQWQFLRVRSDKARPNHKSVVSELLVELRDGITAEEVGLAWVQSNVRLTEEVAHDR